MQKLISIVGASGVGKTTFVNTLAKTGKFATAFEQHAERPFQSLFKQDNKYALANQMDYLLLRAEQDGFEAFITADSNLRHQQNLVRCRIAIIVLRSPSNRLSKHAEMLSDILTNLKEIDQGEVIEIFHPNHHDR